MAAPFPVWADGGAFEPVPVSGNGAGVVPTGAGCAGANGAGADIWGAKVGGGPVKESEPFPVIENGAWARTGADDSTAPPCDGGHQADAQE